MTVRTDKTLVLYAIETSYGVIPTSGWRRLGFHDSITLPDIGIEWFSQYGMTSLKRKRILRGPLSFSGSIQKIRLVDPFFLNHCFPLRNSESAEEVSSIPSFSLAVGLYNENGTLALGRIYSGGKINRATISMEEDLTLSVDEMLFNGYTHTSPNAASVRFSGYFPSQVAAFSGDDRYTFAGANIQIAGLTILHLNRFMITVNNNLKPRYVIQTQPFLDYVLQPKNLLEGAIEYKGEFMVDMRADNDFQLWDQLTNQSGFSILANFTNRTSSLNVTCSPFAFNTAYGGTMFEKSEWLIDGTKGVTSVTLSANIDKVKIN